VVVDLLIWGAWATARKLLRIRLSSSRQQRARDPNSNSRLLSGLSLFVLSDGGSSGRPRHHRAGGLTAFFSQGAIDCGCTRAGSDVAPGVENSANFNFPPGFPTPQFRISL